MKFIKKRDKNPLVPGHYFLFNWVKPFIKKKTKILDIGCWTGPLEILFEKTEAAVTGIDIEDGPLKYASKRFPQYRFKNVSIIDKLPFKDGEFNIVLFFMVLEHIPRGSELVALRNINKVMKKGGRLCMNTMNSNVLSNLLDPAYFFGHRHYSEKHLRDLLSLAGFKVEKITFNAGFFTTAYIITLYFFKHVLRRAEPRGIFDKLMELDYKNRGFAEIDIQAIKVAHID